MAEPEEMYQCQTVSCGYIITLTRETEKEKLPKGPGLPICRRTGNVRFAVLERKCSNPLAGPTR